jgi:hypothetical protein
LAGLVCIKGNAKNISVGKSEKKIHHLEEEKGVFGRLILNWMLKELYGVDWIHLGQGAI